MQAYTFWTERRDFARVCAHSPIKPEGLSQKGYCVGIVSAPSPSPWVSADGLPKLVAKASLADPAGAVSATAATFRRHTGGGEFRRNGSVIHTLRSATVTAAGMVQKRAD